jgi:hypothetical protein
MKFLWIADPFFHEHKQEFKGYGNKENTTVMLCTVHAQGEGL